MLQFILFNLLTGPLTLLLGLMVLRKPPRFKNPAYGYRTQQSKKSEAHWEFAHRVVGRLLVAFGTIITIFQALIVGFMGWEKTFLLSLFSMLFFLILSVVLTEDQLKRRFADS
ncbi:MAG: SdpI family protein [Bacteroidota bacterium]